MSPKDDVTNRNHVESNTNFYSVDQDCNRYQFTPIEEHSNKHFPVNYHGFLSSVVVVNSLSLLFPIFLNAMILMPAITFCWPIQLSVTDLVVGLITQPLHVTPALFSLLGSRFHEFCHVTLVFNASFKFPCDASLFHLVLISAERCFTIEHPISRSNLITKARLVIPSLVTWIAVVIFSIMPKLTIIFLISRIAILSLFVVLQGTVYREVRKHERQILSQQVSQDERVKFQKEKKALKFASTIIAAVVISYMTIIF